MNRSFATLRMTRDVPALMNVIGLGIAFAVFLVLMSQVWWDYRYDRFNGGKDVYIAEAPSPYDGKYSSFIVRPSIPLIKDCSPDIAAVCDYYFTKDDRLGRIKVKDNAGEYVILKGIDYGVTETSVVDVFNIDLLT
ncbi:MAG: hypothetical protein IJ840_00700 [Bacteroidales bacterium]|nr:hypothetical protein [Bacteroidales bacterium]